MSDKSSGSERAISQHKGFVLPLIYQTYLCSEPSGVPLLLQNGPDEYTALLRTLQRSAEHFSEKDQSRSVERIHFEIAKLHMQNKQWERAMRVLVPLWQTLSWRKAGWWNMLEEIDWALRECAGRVRDAEVLLAVQWELMNRFLTPRQDSHLDFRDTLQVLGPLETKPRSVIRAENILLPISASFAFRLAKQHVGEILGSQLVLASQGQSNSKPIAISQIKITFEGGLKDVYISHERNSSSNDLEAIQLTQVSLRKASCEREQDLSYLHSSSGAPHLHGLADLVIATGTMKVLSFDNIPREAGDVEVGSISLFISEQDFDVELLNTEEQHISQDVLYVPCDGRISTRRGKNERSSAAKILPKPPKLRIEPIQVSEEHYTDETLFVNLDMINEEEASADITIDVRLHAGSQMKRAMGWVSEVDAEILSEEDKGNLQNSGTLPPRRIGVIPPPGVQRHCIRLHPESEAAEYTLEFRARYFLLTDPETIIEKVLSLSFRFQLPFEASHSFSPIVHPAPWPKYFDIGSLEGRGSGEFTEGNTANGLIQRWYLVSRVTSLATAALIIEGVKVKVVDLHEDAVCDISSADPASDNSPFHLDELKEHCFTLDAQKIDLEDRRTTFISLQLEIKWSREGSSGLSTTTNLVVPELVIFFGEPRALAHAHSDTESRGPILLDYVLENPSVYALTFNLVMNTSDEFVFSGPKNVTIQLIPLSRLPVSYILLPLISGRWINPQLKVFDTHFHKTLKIHGTEGMRNDKRGISIWVDTEG